MTDAQAKAYQEAAVHLGTAIALGAVPMLGQAIDAYDTIESCWRIHAAKKPDDRENAQFDLILSLVGWVPGPGDGVKKSLRMVNKDPQRFAPILFDLLRKVCEIAGIKTSPEALLEGLFNAGALQAQMATVREAVADYSGFKSLPQWGQDTVLSVLRTAESQLPAMVGIVQRRLATWKRMQPNSSAQAGTVGRPKAPAPQPRDANVAKQGTHRPVGGAPGQTINSTLATAALEIGNSALGIAGEHIGDYYCGQRLGWAGQWDAHDKGSAGQWQGGQPGKTVVGKLSKGGSPKDHGKLYKLSDRANGTGIDAVWRAEGHNQGKRYAVVEYKSDFELQMPAFIKNKPGTARKPGITAKLGVSGVPELEAMLTTEPPEKGSSGKPAGARKPAGKPRSSSPTPNPQARPPFQPKPTNHASGPLVQMSREWIEVNLRQAVGPVLVRDVLVGYSRHLIYTPMWLPSTIEHAKAMAAGTGAQESTHRDHDVMPNLHYEETEVKAAVNKKKAGLRTKYPNAVNLKVEA